MAIARANCTCATCGHQFEIRVAKRNSSEARSFEAWAEANITECRDCEEKRIKAAHDAENAKAAEAAQEMGYPDLVGTEKQVAWANTIREAVVNTLREYYMDEKRIERHPEYPREFEGIRDILLGHVQAGWWIEKMRGVQEDLREIIRRLCTVDRAAMEALAARLKGEDSPASECSEAEAEFHQNDAPKPAEKPVRPEAVPEQRKHEGSVDVKIDGQTVIALYDKDEAFRQIVKGMGFTWGSGWKIKCGERTGDPANVAAELGSRLLNAGFAVRFDSQEILDRAVSGDYVPMCHRWVLSHAGAFFLVWGKDDDLYREARSLPGSKYVSPGVEVPERSWAAVADFAAKHGYRFTAMAQEKMDKLSGAARTVAPEKPQEPQYNEQDVLKSSREILPDLRDDDGTQN